MQCISVNGLLLNAYIYMYMHTRTYSSLGAFEFNVTEFSAQEEDADIDDDPVLDQGTGDIVDCIATYIKAACSCCFIVSRHTVYCDMTG